MLATRLGGAIGIWLGGIAAVGCALAVAGRGWMRIAAGLGILYLVGLAAVGALIPELTQRPHVVTRVVAVAMVGLGATVLLTAVGRRLATAVKLRRVREDLREGTADCFEGMASPLARELEQLRRRGHPPNAGEALRLDVLPRSGLVVCVHGKRCKPWISAHLASVAVGQPHALRAGLPEGVAPTGAAGRLSLQRRSLSAEERAELDRHIERLRRNPWAAIAATIGLVAAASWQLHHGPAVEGWGALRRLFDPMMVGWYALALLTVVGYARRAIAARKLDDDRRLRWVVTVDDQESAGALRAARLEVLPVSQLAWTENATPASWRTSKL